LKTIAIDLDGVIHKYSRGWQDGSIYDGPTEGCADALAELAQRYRVVVFTTRGADRNGELAVWDWLRKHDLAAHVAEVTALKPPASFYIDDRAIRHSDWVTTGDLVRHYEALETVA